MVRDDILQTKLGKLQQLQENQINPYPEKTDRTHSASQVLEDFAELEKQDKKVILAGRIRSLRPMGGSAFASVEDASGKIQLFLNKNNIGEKDFKLFVKTVELGDFVEVGGEVFQTKTGEKTLKVTNWKMLAKNLRPIPTEHFGIKDEEELLRKRYLDLMVNPQTRELFRKKNIFWQSVRSFLVEQGFLEVQTPVLEHTPGGADAEPFVTHHNALDQDFFMRISLELPLKRLLVGGLEKVFEIGRVFRNEGIDRQHLQEFDHMEFYWAYGDLEKGMEMAEKMYRQIVQNVLGVLEHEYDGQKIDWSKKFPRIDYFEVFRKETGLDLSNVSVESLRAKADELKIKYDQTYGKGKMIDTIYKKTVRQKMIQPCFLVGHPIEVSPLAKRDPENPQKVLRFQIVAGTAELCNAFSELNDPIDQRGRFEDQMKLREAGDSEAQMIDEDFLEAMEYGLPPAFGFGMSERFFSFLMNRSIRECVIFPPMKEKGEVIAKEKEAMIAAVVINNSAGLEQWQKMNTVAHLNAAFAARTGGKLFLQDEILTKDDKKIKLNIKHAIMIKEAVSTEDISDLAINAKSQGFEVAEFTREMLETTNDKLVAEKTKEKDLNKVEYLGILVFGRKKEVEKLTAGFKLMK